MDLQWCVPTRVDAEGHVVPWVVSGGPPARNRHMLSPVLRRTESPRPGPQVVVDLGDVQGSQSGGLGPLCRGLS